MVAEESPEDHVQKRTPGKKLDQAWKRMVQQIMFMLETARRQMVTDYIVMKDEKIHPERTTATASSSKQRATVSGPIHQGIGEPLPRSQSHKKWECEPGLCPHGPDHSYVYTKDDSFVNWLADSHGKKDTLDKADNKFLREALTTTAYENGGAVSPSNFRDQARQLGWHIGKAMEMATGWNFATTGRHRGEALRLVAEHRPALLWLGHRPELAESELHLDFVVQLARIQLQAGRGFLVACPTRERPSGLRPLLEDPRVLQVLLAGSPPCSVLVTNVDSMVSAMHNRSLQATGSLLSPVAQPDFAEHILKGLRRHLQRQHFPVFGLSDRWEWSCGELVCRHFQPRREAVSPRQCQCFDLTNVKFSGLRTTFKDYVGKPAKVVVDTWTSTSTAGPDLQLWTGSTHFELTPTVLLPRPAAEYADWLAKAAAHALFAHQSEEFAFQCEWLCMFPSHRILEGRASRSTTSDAAPTTPPDGEAVGSPTLSEVEDLLDSPPLQPPPLQLPEEGDEALVRKELRDLGVGSVPDPRTRGSDTDIVDPPPELRRELYRLRRNLGHPDLGTFCRALRNARVRPDLIKWTKMRFSCPICEKRKRPGTHRPAHLSRQMEFNSVIGVDLVFYQKKILVNCLCWGTNYQMAMVVSSKNTEEVTRAVYQGWFKYFGPPHLMVVDQGTEFSSRHFTDTLGEWGTVIHFTDVRSPWQNSRTERAGASLKSVLGKILDEQVAITNEEFEQAVDAAVWCRNQYFDRSGFSPFQRVFGKSMRTPYALMSDDVIDRDLVNHTHSDHMRKAQEMRTKAMKAWAEVQDETAIQRAVRTSAKTSDEKVFADGDVVYVWRQTTDYTGWVGPGVVISQTANGRSLWVSLRGYLIKASREQVRMATNEEHLGAELIKVISKEMLEKLEQGETKHFRDIQREGGPPLESPILDSEMGVPPPENPSPLLTIDEKGELNEAVSDAPVEAVAPPTLESRRSSTVAPPTLESPRPSTVAPPTLESRRPSTVAPPTLESRRPSTVAPPTWNLDVPVQWLHLRWNLDVPVQWLHLVHQI